MAIDPSIIGNVMAPAATQLPDVNAMMQTRTAGLENVYKIETARQQMAKEEAAATRKQEEDAAIKALLPAYAYGFKNPSDPDGMLALVPPERREALAPYVDQIRNLPPEQVVAALTGSLISSDVGRAFLENQARMRTAQIQQGQLTVAQQREAREAATAGIPKPMTAAEAAAADLAERRFAAEQAAKLEAPKIKLEAGRSKVDDTLSEMLLSYNRLKQEIGRAHV